MDTLNKMLKSQDGFFIDSKDLKYYEKASKPYLKNKILIKLQKYNPSLKIFIEELAKKNIILEKEDDW